VWVIVVAGGNGTRFGAAKQYELLGDDKRVLDWSVATARAVADGVVVVVPEADAVRNGLAAVPEDADVIVVHDACRPLASVALFAAVIESVRNGADGAVPGLPVADTIKQIDEHGRVVATPLRASLRAVQTPQAFRAATLRAAHAAGGEATDDAALIEAHGATVMVVTGEDAARKITVAEDLAWARRYVADKERS
jgi:2-C-methyl-D-erythritol 4-phosphate cytidylyltransferase